MEKIELRIAQSSLTAEDNDLIVEGLVNKTESWSHMLGQKKRFREKISKGAFTRAIESAPRIDFLAEHDSSKILSTTDNDSLQIWEDAEGLKIRAKICPTTYGEDIYKLMKHKIVNHMSFGFRVIADKWKKLTDGTFERTVDSLELIEVSAVRNPAYPQSAIAARGMELIEDVDIPEDILEERGSEEMNEKEIQEIRDFMKSINDRFDNIEKMLEEERACGGKKEEKAKEEDKKEPMPEDNKEPQAEGDKKEEPKAEDKKPEEGKEPMPEDKKEEKAKDDKKDGCRSLDDSEEDKKDDENRSFDLSAYRKRIKERM